jgi:glutamate N-acetyltransferase/amino-acid N-acetyltransferase
VSNTEQKRRNAGASKCGNEAACAVSTYGDSDAFSALPLGFRAAAVGCGIKRPGPDGDNRLDVALIIGDKPLSAAALFTQNQFRAAPLVISAAHLRSSQGLVRALLINSGCANAATGEEGVRRAQHVIDELSRLIGCKPHEILTNSTGVIGMQLPDDKIVRVLPALVQKTTAWGSGARRCGSGSPLRDVASAIMTTDTRPKVSQVRFDHDGREYRVVGVAKGAGMIHPNMATMIAVVMTDAAVDPRALDRMLRRAVDRSFHRISIDGDTSTNDAVFALASGEAGARGAPAQVPDDAVEPAITSVCRNLALQVVQDGEGACRLIHVRVRGASSPEEALRVAQTVAGSMLVRTAVAGGDPNWGRVVAAVGRSGVAIAPNRLIIAANDVPLFSHGSPAQGPQQRKEKAFQQQTVVLDIDLGLGHATDEFFTCDLTEDYVRINSHYMT